MLYRCQATQPKTGQATETTQLQVYNWAASSSELKLKRVTTKSNIKVSKLYAWLLASQEHMPPRSQTSECA